MDVINFILVEHILDYSVVLGQDHNTFFLDSPWNIIIQMFVYTFIQSMGSPILETW
mgnify:CR=1 FL=1